jgi:hypothetical protein
MSARPNNPRRSPHRGRTHERSGCLCEPGFRELSNRFEEAEADNFPQGYINLPDGSSQSKRIRAACPRQAAPVTQLDHHHAGWVLGLQSRNPRQWHLLLVLELHELQHAGRR